ncbi:MAG: ferrous iron transport protein B [Marinilabiliales bacterium]|nr:MAG: ferrous iron transport protein B [Marinilabiliales bacterium]
MKLSELTNGHKGIITKVKGSGALRTRILEMGFVRGKEILVVKNAPLKDPIEYSIMGYEVSLRRSEAELIEVITPMEAKNLKSNEFEGIITENELKISAKEKGRKINIALVGNPNAGKTTLFNYASKSKERVGNYGGVTVDAKHGIAKHKDYQFDVVDLPGTYSLTAYSPEELFVRDHIFTEYPDIVINVIDASNLERNLYLTTQLIDMDIKVIIALNMYDELIKHGDKFDYNALGKLIGIPIVPTVSSKGKGIEELFDKIIDVYEDKDPTVRHIHINYGKEVESSIRKIQEEIWKSKSITDKLSSRYIALRLIENDKWIHSYLQANLSHYDSLTSVVNKEIARLENCCKNDTETLLTDARYGFISGALKETFQGGIIEERNTTRIIDTIITHKLFGFPVFFFFIWLMFQTTFTVVEYPMNWIEWLVTQLSGIVESSMAEGPIRDLLVNGIIAGVGSVIIFLPNIIILFFFISLMEDTGYMARAAFIMDKIMHKIGFHGQSFIPMIMGFGCNVPAIISTRMLKNKNDRILTMLINPFMSCSARFPVYVLVAGAFFGKNAGNVIFSIYLIGILLAILVAIVFNKLFFKSKDVPFVMELPPYRLPTLKAITRHMWHKSVQYLQKMGGIILIASIIIWALGYYPRNVEMSKDYDTLIKQANKIEEVNKLKEEKAIEHKEKSYIGMLGKTIEPIMEPLGFDWRMSVSILTGIAAKEVVVSTMGVLFAGDESMQEEALIDRLVSTKYSQGEKAGTNVFNPLVAYTFMLFILIYFPCMATIVAIRKESGSWKWALFSIFYTTSLAWIISFLVFQTGTLISQL